MIDQWNSAELITTAFVNLLKYYKSPESYMFHTFFYFTIHVLSKVYLKIWNWQGLALNRNKDIISYFISNREQWKRAKFIIWCWAFKKIYQEELFVSVCHSTEVYNIYAYVKEKVFVKRFVYFNIFQLQNNEKREKSCVCIIAWLKHTLPMKWLYFYVLTGKN